MLQDCMQPPEPNCCPPSPVRCSTEINRWHHNQHPPNTITSVDVSTCLQTLPLPSRTAAGGIQKTARGLWAPQPWLARWSGTRSQSQSPALRPVGTQQDVCAELRLVAVQIFEWNEERVPGPAALQVCASIHRVPAHSRGVMRCSQPVTPGRSSSAMHTMLMSAT